MAIVLTCSCNRQVSGGAVAPGQSIRCPDCNRVLQVPAAVPARGAVWPWIAGVAGASVLLMGMLAIAAVRLLPALRGSPEAVADPSPSVDPVSPQLDKLAVESPPPGKLLAGAPNPPFAVGFLDKLRTEELDLTLLTESQPQDLLPALTTSIPPRPAETVAVELQPPTAFPSTGPRLTREQMVRYELIVDRFIQFDIGRLRGAAGQQALNDFNSLGEDALPALVNGVNRASYIQASCPVIVMAGKLRTLVSTTNNLDSVAFVRDHIGKGVYRAVHQGVLESVRAQCADRRRVLLGQDSERQVSQVVGLVEALAAPDAVTRRNAAIVLGSRGRGARTAVPALVKALKDPEKDVRGQAARALVEIGPDAVPALVEALKDDKVRGLAQLILSEGFPIPRAAIPDVIASLRDPDPEVRAVAQHALVKLGDAAVPFLIEALQDKERARMAALLLGHLGARAQAAIAALTATLKDPDREVRRAAHHALVRIGPAAVPSLMGALKGPDPKVGCSAAVALGKIGPAAREAVPALAAALQGADKSLQVLALDALLKIEPRNPQIAGAATEALPWIIDVLTYRDPALRSWAAGFLSQIGPTAKSAVPALVSALRDPESPVRGRAAEALGRIGPDAEPAVATLIELLQDPTPDVRARSAQALGRIGPTAQVAIPALIAALKEPATAVHGAANEALIQLAPASIPALAAALKDRSEVVRSGSADALAKIGGPAVTALTEMIQDPQAGARGLAIDTLGRIGPEARAAAPALIAALGDADQPIRLRAVAALGCVDPAGPETLQALKRTLAGSNQEVGTAAQQALIKAGKPAVAVLTEALTDSQADLRLAAVDTLRKMGPSAAEAVPGLLAALTHPERQMRTSCTNALSEIAATVPAVQQAFLKGFEDADEEVRIASHLALVKLGKAAIPVLTVALKRPEVAIRRGAAEGLKKIATEVQEGRAEVHAAAPDLIGALTDADREVRDEAAWALGEIDADLKGAVPGLIQALTSRKSVAGRPLPEDQQLRYVPLARLLEAVPVERGQRLKLVLAELEQRRGSEVLAVLAQALSHKEVEIQHLARTTLLRYLAHKPTEQQQKDAASRLYLSRLLAQGGKLDKARERYRELVQARPRTRAAEEARQLLTSAE